MREETLIVTKAPEANEAPLFHFAPKRLKGERLITVSNIPARHVLTV